MNILCVTDSITVIVKINKSENISQFILIALILYMAYSPPAFFTRLINSSIANLV
jgi:hypothetical protein